MIKKISSPKKKYILEAKKFKAKKIEDLTAEDIKELVILLAKKEGFLK